MCRNPEWSTWTAVDILYIYSVSPLSPWAPASLTTAPLTLRVVEDDLVSRWKTLNLQQKKLLQDNWIFWSAQIFWSWVCCCIPVSVKMLTRARSCLRRQTIKCTFEIRCVGVCNCFFTVCSWHQYWNILLNSYFWEVLLAKCGIWGCDQYFEQPSSKVHCATF